MADETYRYCKMFLRASPREAKELLARSLEAPFQRDLMRLSAAELEVLRNPEAGAADSFLGWPTLVEVEVEAAGGADRASVVGITAKVVKAMWDAGVPTVAACDYEDELPWRGGIGRLDAPDRDFCEGTSP